MKFLILTTLLLISTCMCYAAEDNIHLQLGVSAYHLNIDDPKYHSVKKDPQLNFNVGASYKIDNFFIAATTNRLLNRSMETKVERNGVDYTNDTKSYIDAVSFGYIYQRFMPSIFIARADVKKSLYYQNRMVGSNKQTAPVYGGALSYFFARNIYSSIIFVAPQPKLYLKSSVGVGLTFIL